MSDSEDERCDVTCERRCNAERVSCQGCYQFLEGRECSPEDMLKNASQEYGKNVSKEASAGRSSLQKKRESVKMEFLVCTAHGQTFTSTGVPLEPRLQHLPRLGPSSPIPVSINAFT